MSKYIRELVIFLLGVIFSALIISKCFNNNKEIKQGVLKKVDTVYKQVIVPKENKYVKEVIKIETLRIRDTFVVKTDTTYALNLYRYQFRDNFLFVSFLANYVDTSSFVYEIKYNPIKLRQYNQEIGFILKQSSYEIFYSRRVLWNFSIISSIEKEFYNNNFKIGVGISFRF